MAATWPSVDLRFFIEPGRGGNGRPGGRLRGGQHPTFLRVDFLTHLLYLIAALLGMISTLGTRVVHPPVYPVIIL